MMPALTTSILLALAVGNFGLLLRERTQVFVLLLPLFCLGLAMRTGAAAEGVESGPDESRVTLAQVPRARL
jgi:hypothetical protein